MRVELKRGTLNDLFTLKELVSMNYIDTCDKDITQAYITEYIDKTFTIPKLSKELTREDSLFYLMYVDKKLVGYTKLNKYEAQLDIKSPKSLEIEKIYILKDYQSKGLGKTLLNEIKDILIKIDTRYKLDLNGFYKIKVYPNQKIGVFLNIIKIDDNEFNQEADFRIIIYQNEPFLFETEEYEILPKNINKRYYKDNFI